MTARVLWWIVVVSACFGAPSCYYASGPDPTSGGDAGSVTSSEFPCAAATVLATCWGCHTSPPRGGAPMSLAHPSDLAAPSAAQPGSSLAERALARIRDTARPMPPAGLPRPDAASVAAFAAWIADGRPSGTCTGVHAPPDAGTAETICTSQLKWPIVWRDGSSDLDPRDMNPGLPCRACHQTEKPSRAFFFMGTAFPTLHEQDRCFSTVPQGTRVEILDANGQVALTMSVRARGNFFSNSRTADVALPFTARVVTPNGAISQMTTPQMTGDCNGCHTEQGANGAPGRIVLPAMP